MAEEEDIISLLPDCLLLDIISRLELSTKEVIQTTTTISKRWQHIWTRLPTLVFIDQDDILNRRRKHAFANYFSFIDKTISECPTDVNLKKIKFHIEDYKVYNNPGNTTRPISQVNSWIRYAITRNVQEVDIRIQESYHKFSYDDELFFNNSCIKSMKLSHCVFNPPNGAISWDKLKCLCIDRGTLDEHSLGISRCPCLETLELNDCCLSRRFLKSFFGNFELERLSCDLETYERFSNHLFNDDEFDDGDDESDDHEDESDDHDDESDDHDDEFDDDGDKFLSIKFYMSIKFSRCEFNPPNGAICWDKLTFLCIGNGELDEDSIGKILFKSPCLETLKLKGCSGFRRINVTSKSVKNLVLHHGYGYRFPGGGYIYKLEINAPYILSLKIIGKMYLEELLLLDVSSLVKADLNYLGSHHFAEDLERERDDMEEDLLTGLLSRLAHVNDITLGDYNCLQALTRLKDKGFQFSRVGADGDEDRITELIDSGRKKAREKWKKDAAAEKKKQEKWERQIQEKILEKQELKRQEKLEETGESDDDMLFGLFD